LLLYLSVVQKKLLEAESLVETQEQELNELVVSKQKMDKENKELADQNGRLTTLVKSYQTTSALDARQAASELEKSFQYLSAVDPQKADDLLRQVTENPEALITSIFVPEEAWTELVEKDGNTSALSEMGFIDALISMTPDQLTNIKDNMTTIKDIPKEALEERINTKPSKVAGNNGNNWPPIISLGEARDYSFPTGSAVISETFSQRLSSEISADIKELLDKYDADVIEIIGHTDAQPMSSNRNSNLDNVSKQFVMENNQINLAARDNAGLGFARALAVTRELMKVQALEKYTILPYSAAQMILPNESLDIGTVQIPSAERRRIEIRVRRKSNTEQ
jgi:flagellar motor protein MotB